MAVTPYRPQNWSDDEPVFGKKLRVMTSNDQWLFENMPRGQYRAYGVTRNEGVKIASGVVLFTPFVNAFARTVEFGTFFSTACNPVVVVGSPIAPYGHLQANIKGLDALAPDHRGFVITGLTTLVGSEMKMNFYFPWVAIGF